MVEGIVGIEESLKLDNENAHACKNVGIYYYEKKGYRHTLNSIDEVDFEIENLMNGNK